MIEIPHSRDVLAGCIRDTKFLSTCLSLLKPEDFVGEQEQSTFKTLGRFYRQYDRSPTIAEFKEFAQGRDVELQIELISPEPDLGIDILSDKVTEFARRLSLSKAVIDSVDLIEQGEYEKVEALVRSALLVGSRREIGLDYFSTVADRLLFEERECVSSGIRDLDSILRGGFAKGELTTILGASGGGKSMALVGFGRAGILSNKGVIIYTLELSDREVATRLDASIAGVPYGRTKDYYSVVLSKVGRYHSLSGKSSLIIKEFPTRGASVSDIRTHLREAQAFMKPSLLIVDYADVLLPTRRTDKKYEELQTVYEELRGLAMEFNVAIVTASQVNRDALSRVWIDVDNVSESFGKIMTADVVLAINRTRDEEERNLARLAVIKNRTGVKGSFYIRTNFTKAVFATAEEITVEDVENNPFEDSNTGGFSETTRGRGNRRF
jgi:replicative DNA helicase